MPAPESAQAASPQAIRWGILGPGGIAGAFTADLLLTGHNVTAVGSRSQERADTFAADFRIPTAHGSYEQLVADPEVDVIYVATPHSRHHDDVRLALLAGKHVLVEKPFTINAAQARSLVELATDRGLVLLEAMWTRWLPHMVAVREQLAAGAIGEVRALIADHTQLLSDDPSHRLNALELGGGALLDLGVYPISFAFDVLGAPEHVLASATLKPTGADGETAVVLHGPEGRTASIFTASTMQGPNKAAVIGTRGRIEIDGVWYTPTSFTVYDSGGAATFHYSSDVPGRGMQFQADEMRRLIAAGERESSVLPLSETVAIMATMDEVRRQIGLRYPGE